MWHDSLPNTAHTAAVGNGKAAWPSTRLSRGVQGAVRPLLAGSQGGANKFGRQAGIHVLSACGVFEKSVHVYLYLWLHFWEEGHTRGCQKTNM